MIERIQAADSSSNTTHAVIAPVLLSCPNRQLRASYRRMERPSTPTGSIPSRAHRACLIRSSTLTPLASASTWIAAARSCSGVTWSSGCPRPRRMPAPASAVIVPAVIASVTS